MEQPGDIYIYATVKSPAPCMMVIQVITWPYTIIRFENDNIEQVNGEIQDSSSPVNNTVDK